MLSVEHGSWKGKQVWLAVCTPVHLLPFKCYLPKYTSDNNHPPLVPVFIFIILPTLSYFLSIFKLFLWAGWRFSHLYGLWPEAGHLYYSPWTPEFWPWYSYRELSNRSCCCWVWQPQGFARALLQSCALLTTNTALIWWGVANPQACYSEQLNW